jgi:hypothetical protein
MPGHRPQRDDGNSRASFFLVAVAPRAGIDATHSDVCVVVGQRDGFQLGTLGATAACLVISGVASQACANVICSLRIRKIDPVAPRRCFFCSSTTGYSGWRIRDQGEIRAAAQAATISRRTILKNGPVAPAICLRMSDCPAILLAPIFVRGCFPLIRTCALEQEAADDAECEPFAKFIRHRQQEAVVLSPMLPLPLTRRRLKSTAGTTAGRKKGRSTHSRGKITRMNPNLIVDLPALRTDARTHPTARLPIRPRLQVRTATTAIG